MAYSRKLYDASCVYEVILNYYINTFLRCSLDVLYMYYKSQNKA